MRLDVVLHELRLFKSRTQAVEAIDEGRVLLGGRASKASHAVKPGDHITVIGPRGSRTVELLELPRRSLSRDEAKLLMREVSPSAASGGS